LLCDVDRQGDLRQQCTRFSGTLPRLRDQACQRRRELVTEARDLGDILGELERFALERVQRFALQRRQKRAEGREARIGVALQRRNLGFEVRHLGADPRAVQRDRRRLRSDVRNTDQQFDFGERGAALDFGPRRRTVEGGQLLLRRGEDAVPASDQRRELFGEVRVHAAAKSKVKPMPVCGRRHNASLATPAT
jgi:hypothetical protein